MVSTVSDLSFQLQQAKEQLKETDESIKKVTGRDNLEVRSAVSRSRDPQSQINSFRGPPIRSAGFSRDNASFTREPDRPRPSYDDVPNKRPRAMNTFHPVLPENDPGNSTVRSDRDRRRGGWDDDDDYRRRKIQSTVIVDSTPGKTREERIVESQTRVGDKDVARNRRIFGSLMGTLKKFQQEQSNRAPTDDRQKEIQKKLEEKESTEKRQAQRERRELFWERKRKIAVIKFLETKVDILKRFEDWEASQKPLLKFIRTEGSQPIYYCPKKINKLQEAKLESSKKIVEAAIQTRREAMEAQLRRLDHKIEYINRPQQSGPEINLEEDIEKTRKKMIEDPVDDIDVEALLDDTEVEGLELIAIDDQVKSEPGAEMIVEDTTELPKEIGTNGEKQDSPSVNTSDAERLVAGADHAF